MTNYPANELQPPLGLPRRITHPNLPEGKEQVTLPMNISPLSVSPVGEMLVCIVNEKTIDSQVATSYNKTVKGICPSPTGEVRWGLEVCDLGIS